MKTETKIKAEEELFLEIQKGLDSLKYERKYTEEEVEIELEKNRVERKSKFGI